MLQLNLKNNAASQTTENFNSMCRVGDKYYGASDTGIYRICGYSDNGVMIPALIKSGTMDFGMDNQKRFRFFYFGVETDGELLLKVYCDNVLAGQMTVVSKIAGMYQVRVPINRSYKSRYWSWSIENVTGTFFALSSVTALPVILHPGRG